MASRPSVVLLLLLSFSAFMVETVFGIYCFVCSKQSPTLGCPNKNDSPDTWAQNSNAYYDVTVTNQVHACITGYSTELAVQNQVFYQVRGGYASKKYYYIRSGRKKVIIDQIQERSVTGLVIQASGSLVEVDITELSKFPCPGVGSATPA